MMVDPPLFDTNILSELLKRNVEKNHPVFYDWVATAISQHGVCVSSVSLYELRRWFRKLELQGEGRRKRAWGQKMLHDATVFWVDAGRGRAWNVAADIWARGQLTKPATVFQDADLLIYATALAYGRRLVTCDAKLGELLHAVEVDPQVVVLALE